MPRPGLVIGLGGTGQWVLTWLKRDLMLSNRGDMPPTVRLLEFDTAKRLEASAARITDRTRLTEGNTQEEAASVGGVSLKKDDEFIHIGGNALTMAQLMVDSAEYPHIHQWFNAEFWLQTQPQSTFNLDEGAGRLRQFGRLAIYKDVLGGSVNSVIWRALVNAMESVRSKASEKRPLEILLVGSFAGGTGSGIFIDIALILRLLANKYKIPHVMRGLFALPSVFTAQPSDEMMARCFAAWRELNRFMVVDDEFSMPEITYLENDSNFSIRPAQRLFDACYLVDGRRNGMPLAEDPKAGVFPMLAEAISAFLDENAGAAYSEWILNNLALEYAKTPYTPMYSTLGAYTVQVPAYYLQEKSRHELARDVLQQLLQPQSLPDASGRLPMHEAGRLMALAAPDKNGEDPNFAGRSRSDTLFKESVEFEGQTEKPTVFVQRIGQLLTDNSENQKRVANVTRQAKAGAAASNELSARDGWLGYFANFGQDQELVQMRKDIEAELNIDMPKRYGKQDDKEQEDPRRARLKKIPDDMLRRFGAVKASGEVDYGTSGQLLGEVARTQIRFFKRLIRARVTNMLMGRSEENILAARSGKLGYAYDFFDGVVKGFDEILGFMDDVRQEREALTPEAKLAGLSNQAQQMIIASTGKKLLWFWEHPDVLKAERVYLQAQQRTMQLRREEVLHVIVAETMRQMRDICVEVREALQRWIWHLATGDSASNLPGLWEGVRLGLERINVTHSADKQMKKVQKIVSEQSGPATPEEVKRALKQWEWEATFDQKFNLQAVVRAEAQNRQDQVLHEPVGGNSPQSATDNQSALLELAGRSFAGQAAMTTVAEELKRTYSNRPDQLADDVADVEPLFEGLHGKNPRKKSNLIRVQTDPSDSFFIGESGLEGALRGKRQLDKANRTDTYAIQVVGSENQYKMTLVRTDDLYNFDAFSAWAQCLSAYDKHIKAKDRDLLEPRLMHGFAAEAHATGYERRIVRKTYKPLHPRVVMILEDPKACRQFIYLTLLGYINRVDEAGRLFRWELNWEEKGHKTTYWLTRGWHADNDRGRRKKPNALNALHGYVIKRFSQQEELDTPIDYAYAESLLSQRLRELGPHGEDQLLQTAGKKFLESLYTQAYKYPEKKDGLVEENSDLADFAQILEMMLEDWSKEAQERASDLQTAKPSESLIG